MNTKRIITIALTVVMMAGVLIPTVPILALEAATTTQPQSAILMGQVELPQSTIFVGPINSTPYTRAEFITRRGDGVVIYDGRTYSAENFFDTYHGRYFGIYSTFAGNHNRPAEIRVRLHNENVIRQITHRQPAYVPPDSASQQTPTSTPQPTPAPTLPATPQPTSTPTATPLQTPNPTPAPQLVPIIPSDQVRIRIDGQFIDTGDQPPVIIDSRTLVPLRAVMEALGFEVGWNEVIRTASMIKPGYSIAATIDSHVMLVNTPEVSNITVPLEVAPQIINGRTMVPIRAISEATGFDVGWDGENRIVDIDRTGSANDNDGIDAEDGNYTGNAANRNVIPVLFDAPSLLTTDELIALASMAPNDADTRSATTLPIDRRLTDAELDAWALEYRSFGGINTFELELIMLINEYRASQGLNPLAISMELSMAARFKAQGRLDLNYQGHISPIYGSSTDRGRMFGFSGAGVQENIQGGGHTPEGVLTSWQNSAGHRAALLHTQATEIGIGRVGFTTIMKIGF